MELRPNAAASNCVNASKPNEENALALPARTDKQSAAMAAAFDLGVSPK